MGHRIPRGLRPRNQQLPRYSVPRSLEARRHADAEQARPVGASDSAPVLRPAQTLPLRPEVLDHGRLPRPLRAGAHPRPEGDPVKRILNPATNLTGITSALFALWALGNGVWNVVHNHQAAVDPQVIVAALGAVGFLVTRFTVTPVAEPRDGSGNPLHGPLQGPVPPLKTALASHSTSPTPPGHGP